MSVTMHRRPTQHLVIEFTFADVPSGKKYVGEVGAGQIVSRVSLAILTPFNAPLSLEVGRSDAPAELMLGSDSDATIAGVYQSTPEVIYNTSTGIYLTFLAGVYPSQGSGKLIVYID